MASPIAANPITCASPTVKQDEEKKGTVASSIINLLATAMGGGLLSLPRALAECGVVLGGFFLLGAGVSCAYTLVILVMCARDSKRNSFESNAEFFIGPIGARLTNVCLILVLVLASAAMSVIMKDLAPLVLRSFLGSSKLLEDHLVALYMNVLMFPLAAQKEINVLRYTSFCALFCLGYFFACLIVKFFQDPHVEPTVVAINPNVEMLEGLPIMFSAFLCQFNIFKIDYELKPECKKKITQVILISIPLMACMVYVIGGLIGYLLLGTTVQNDLLKNWANDEKFTIARLMLSLTNMFKLPLLMIPLRESIIDMFKLDKETWDRPALRYPLCFALMSLQFGIACSLSSLSKVLALIGCTAGILISFVLPSMMFLEHLRRVEREGTSILHSFSNLSVLTDPNLSNPSDVERLRAEPEAPRRFVSGHPKSMFFSRKAPAWTLIIAALVAGISSLINLIVNWDKA